MKKININYDIHNWNLNLNNSNNNVANTYTGGIYSNNAPQCLASCVAQGTINDSNVLILHQSGSVAIYIEIKNLDVIIPDNILGYTLSICNNIVGKYISNISKCNPFVSMVATVSGCEKDLLNIQSSLHDAKNSIMQSIVLCEWLYDKLNELNAFNSDYSKSIDVQAPIDIDPNTIIRNYTPHEINIITNTKRITIQSSGVARCIETNKQLGIIGDIPIIQKAYSITSSDLPDPQPGVMYIVSKIVAEIMTNRNDLLIVGDTVRDDSGKVIGCNSLSLYNKRNSKAN